MTNFWDYTASNIFGGNFYLPQYNLGTGNIGTNFNIWSSFTGSSFYMPTIFDFSYNKFNFPSFNFSLPSIQMPVFNWGIKTPAISQKPVQTTVKAENTSITDKAEEAESLITDKSKAEVKDKKVEKQQAKAKTKKAKSGNYGFAVIAEEILPGQYVHKGTYSNTKDLKPYMKETLVKLDKKAAELGYTMVVVDGFRSHECQKAAKKRKPTLCATPGKSAHEYGVAVDIALYKDGKKVKDIRKEVPEFGAYAQSLNLEWGATWKTKYEPWHFNFNNWTTLADVRDEYRRYNKLSRNYLA